MGIVWIWIAVDGLFLLPVSNLLPMLQYMAERFLYLPLIGWLIAFAAIVSAFPRQSIIRLTAFCRHFAVGGDGVEPLVDLAGSGHAVCPQQSGRPHTQRVEDNAVAAIIYLPRVQRFFSGNGTNTVRTAANIADDSAVLSTLEQAYDLFPTNHVVLSYYGTSLALTGQPEKALPFLKRPHSYKPKKLALLAEPGPGGLGCQTARPGQIRA